MSRESKSQHQNKKVAFRRLAARLQEWIRAKTGQAEVPKVTETVRTYHVVDNRVKDHASGLQQTWDEVANDMADMIDARREAL